MDRKKHLPMDSHLIWVKDPFNIKESSDRYFIQKGNTPQQAMDEYDIEFDVPTILLVNNEEMMRAEWKTYEIKEGDVLVLMPVVGDVVTGFIARILVAVVLAVVLTLFLDIPQPYAADQEQGDSVYTLRGQRNKIPQPGDPIPKSYGHVRHFPHYAARSYTQVENNQETLYALFCLGLGKYNVTDKLIGDTPMSQFEEVETAIYQPHEHPTLFPTNVEVSPEVSGGIELFGPNQTGAPGTNNEGRYNPNGVGPYVANSAGTRASRIEVDLNFPRGLFHTNSKGKFRSVSVQTRFEYRPVVAVGETNNHPWTLLDERTTKMRTPTPQRITISVAVPPGRYEVRAFRLNNTAQNYRWQELVQWNGLKAFLDDDKDFGNVTLLAMKARATNNLNSNSRQLINVKMRSIIPVYNATTETWTEEETRNPVWAMCDILRADYGFRLDDQFIDLSVLSDLATQFDNDSIYFDWTFDRRGKVWDACKIAMNVGRAKPLMIGPKASAIQDTAATTPLAGFSHNNIIKNSFKSEVTFRKKYDHDGLLVEYLDPITWKPFTVLCKVGDEEGNNPQKIQLRGCTDRQRAYEWGLYTRGTQVWQKDNISFVTGPEGLTLGYGDLVAVKHDLLPTTQTYIDEQVGSLAPGAIVPSSTNTKISLPKNPEATDNTTHYISLRKKSGEIAGPYEVTAIQGRLITIDEVLNVTDFEVPDTAETATYFFGANSELYKLGKVMSIKPRDDWSAEITIVNYEPRLYTLSGTAPELPRPTLPQSPPDLPVISNLRAVTNPDNLEESIVTWESTYANEYVIAVSEDNGVTYTEVARTPNRTYTLENELASTLYVRVRGINIGPGPWVTWSGSVGVHVNTPSIVTNLREAEPFTGRNLKLTWDVATSADSYTLVFKLGTTVIKTVTGITSNRYTLSNSEALIDARAANVSIDRTITVDIKAVNTVGDSETSEQSFLNPAPPQPVISASIIGQDGNAYRYRVSLNSVEPYDFASGRLYGSTTANFTPSDDNHISNSMPYSSDIPRPRSGVSILYFKYCWMDVWSNTPVYSQEVSISVRA